MAFSSKLNLDSQFFKPRVRDAAFAAAIYESAQDFRQSLKQKMIDSIPSGRVESIGRGTGFETRFQRSRRGQRPAIQTGRLLNSVRAKRLSERSAEVSVIAETDAGYNYGEELQNSLGREILTNEDEKEAQTDFNARLNAALISLI